VVSLSVRAPFSFSCWSILVVVSLGLYTILRQTRRMLPSRTHGCNLLVLQSLDDVRLIELLDTALTERTVFSGPETEQLSVNIRDKHVILTAHNIDHVSSYVAPTVCTMGMVVRKPPLSLIICPTRQNTIPAVHVRVVDQHCILPRRTSCF
jgi:hypothetical protein